MDCYFTESYSSGLVSPSSEEEYTVPEPSQSVPVYIPTPVKRKARDEDKEDEDKEDEPSHNKRARVLPSTVEKEARLQKVPFITVTMSAGKNLTSVLKVSNSKRLGASEFIKTTASKLCDMSSSTQTQTQTQTTQTEKTPLPELPKAISAGWSNRVRLCASSLLLKPKDIHQTLITAYTSMVNEGHDVSCVNKYELKSRKWYRAMRDLLQQHVLIVTALDFD
ncbi:hypothetical protein AbHV_ORF59_2 [Abalone herpesvirus Victoria/AUS/2009]|uniref:Uncharacterized protein n=1 Tax=Abalone herpesvirus (isolate Abalone/Australia/Victoria/2009) TaxID=1241371 RepID=K4JV61_ABHV|nr:hypothetical protein AbHV_ORF59 [Abalone herpesvirus Victoria/AUS/2009]YP_006908768.1 hypothetical protein AbHV_ORF59_2 [Abalone herpesvirus Victoria/AUS/2009]AFU90071.1 hypothetical protein AbHV_ORF59 [Abalone herpesvirus Victoria/AUS/2009]AFU90128.1 hypothetical protein AbHV_ORF59_2 [Abalone herpesvirus Victoria/AUS/2009]